MEVTIPGGLLHNGSIETSVKFLPLTGKIEEELINFSKNIDRPDYVTSVLGSVIESIGGQPISTENVQNLCVADRQYLMLRLAATLNGEQMWLKIVCSHCDSTFDVEVNRSELPVKTAGENYPLITLQLESYKLKVRVPNGADQESIVLASEEQAIRQLLQRCIRSVNGEKPNMTFIDKLDDQEITFIDNALDEASPAICQQLRVTCPECQKEQLAELDHYNLSNIDEQFFYKEIHSIASHYHWSESDILELSKKKRHMYLNFINQSVGMTE